MLAQLVALLTLGVLCSSAPMQRTKTVGALQPDHCFSGSIIKELLNTVRNGTVIEVTDLVVEPRDHKKCVYESLNIFVVSLKANGAKNQNTITQLSKLYECKNFFSEDPNEKCETAEVSRDKFTKTLKDFLLHLNEQI